MAGLIPKDICIEKLREACRRLGRPVQSKDLQHDSVLYNSILHHFGSLHAARNVADIPPPDPRRRWSPELVISEIKRLHASGVRITVQDLINAGYRGLANAAREYCGGLPKARRLAKIRDPKRQQSGREIWDDQRVIEEIQTLHKQGKSIACTRVPRKLRCAARYRFDSYGKAVEAAGFEYGTVRLQREPYTREEILSELTSLSEG